MNLLRHAPSAACFLLLVSLGLSGCATQQTPVIASIDHPEQYRRVYLVEPEPKYEHHKVSSRVAECLQRAGFEVTEVPMDQKTLESRSAIEKKLLSLVGDSNPNDHPLACIVWSLSIFYVDSWRYWSFESLRIEFIDIKKNQVVFTTLKNNYDTPMPENIELNRRFIEISAAFFPGQPNPFKQ